MSGLYAHQKAAMEQMKSGCVLCGEVGSGKSRTALAYFTAKVCGGYSTYDGAHSCLRRPRPLYVITTARKRDTMDWDTEAVPFLISSEGFSVCEFHVDSWNNIGKYTDVHGAFFIFDEQRSVGRGAWSKAFLKIAKGNDWVMLTATPGDVWMDYATLFIANGFYRNITEFRNEHVVYSRFAKYPKIDRYVNTGKLERLRKRILIPMEFSKEAVRHEEWIKVGYDEELYAKFAVNRWNAYENEPILNASQYCQLCRRVVNEDRRRCEAVWNILNRCRKAIIFYNYNYELSLLSEMLLERQYPHAEWNGHRHNPLPDGEVWAYLVQYTAGAEGWNCVTTDTVIFYSLNYSYKIMEQAQGRIDRMNTPYKDLWYYFVFCDADIDKAVRRCLKRKTIFNEKAFAGL